LALYLDVEANAGMTIPLLLEGALKESNGGTTLRGQDWVWVLGP
jgi:hypothetical protein